MIHQVNYPHAGSNLRIIVVSPPCLDSPFTCSPVKDARHARRRRGQLCEDDETERLCLEAALAEARRDPRPNIPNEIIEQKLLKKMGELRKKIAVRAAK